MTTPQRNPSQVNEVARESVVRVTGRGAGAYVFCSEEEFERRIAAEREDAAFEACLVEAVGRGIIDIDAGRYVTSVDAAFARADELGGGVPRHDLRIADEFSSALDEIYPDRVLSRIEGVVRGLRRFPEMGSPRVRSCLAERYGGGLRQVPVSAF